MFGLRFIAGFCFAWAMAGAAWSANREPVPESQRVQPVKPQLSTQKRETTRRAERPKSQAKDAAAPESRKPLPKEAFGPVGVGLPAGSKRISPQDFDALRTQGRLQLTNPQLTREGLSRAARDRQEFRRRLNSQLRNDPAILARVTRKPRADGRRLRQLKDGSYLLQRPRGRAVRLENEEFVARAVADSLQALQNPAVHAANYELLRSRIAATVPERTERSRILSRSPSAMRRGDIRQIESATSMLVSRYLTYVDEQAEEQSQADQLPQPPAGYVSNCAWEEGAGTGGDVSGNCGFSDAGLYQNSHWPLKYRTTCVKDQGARGTCVAFAISAAVEALVARDENRWVNLSEQHLYYNEKNQWFALPPNFGDGLISPLSVANQMLGGFRFAFENRWDYNPSWAREEVVNPPFEYTYVNSCNGYNGTHCSNTNHQGDLVCATQCAGVGPAQYCWETCAYTAAVSGNAQFRITDINPFFNILNPQGGAETARALLATGVPIVAGLNVVESFDAVSDDGYVAFVSGHEDQRGGHAVLLTGYVANANVPAGSPPGSGGGYFVSKNSWGCDSGDGGYYYLPFDWVVKNVVSMTAVVGVGT